MAKFDLSPALRSYFADRAVRTAVDELLKDPAGESLPESTWEEARSFNQALLMALQVRTDFVELLFDVWDLTFGASDLNALGEAFFDWDYSPKFIWEDRYLSREFYRNGSLDVDGPVDDLRVSFANSEVCLQVWRYADNEWNVPATDFAGRANWTCRNEDDDEWAESPSHPFAKFVDNPETVLSALNVYASNAVNALIEIDAAPRR